mmetsp:Transcript_36344/g.111988  ORF Transcript_36344/g.111988 Transcript_36344/m.111988 type:complete len:229 (-) Transcript_36344:291-977(-)
MRFFSSFSLDGGFASSAATAAPSLSSTSTSSIPAGCASRPSAGCPQLHPSTLSSTISTTRRNGARSRDENTAASDGTARTIHLGLSDDVATGRYTRRSRSFAFSDASSSRSCPFRASRSGFWRRRSLMPISSCSVRRSSLKMATRSAFRAAMMSCALIGSSLATRSSSALRAPPSSSELRLTAALSMRSRSPSTGCVMPTFSSTGATESMFHAMRSPTCSDMAATDAR